MCIDWTPRSSGTACGWLKRIPAPSGCSVALRIGDQSLVVIAPSSRRGATTVPFAPVTTGFPGPRRAGVRDGCGETRRGVRRRSTGGHTDPVRTVLEPREDRCSLHHGGAAYPLILSAQDEHGDRAPPPALGPAAHDGATGLVVRGGEPADGPGVVLVLHQGAARGERQGDQQHEDELRGAHISAPLAVPGAVSAWDPLSPKVPAVHGPTVGRCVLGTADWLGGGGPSTARA